MPQHSIPTPPQDYEYDAPAHLERILGNHVSEYMEMLQEEDPERYKVAFSSYIENDIEADAIEDLYKECHTKIREDPKFVKKVGTGDTAWSCGFHWVLFLRRGILL